MKETKNGKKTPSTSRGTATYAADASLFGILSENEEDQANVQIASGDKRKRTAKASIIRARLDEERLLSPIGFPALIKLIDKFTEGGRQSFARTPKDDLKRELSRLLDMYRQWAHALFPRYKSKDVLDSVEKKCHSRHLHQLIDRWHSRWRSAKLAKPGQNILLSTILEESEDDKPENREKMDDFTFSFDGDNDSLDQNTATSSEIDLSNVPKWLKEREDAIRSILQDSDKIVGNAENASRHFDDISDAEFDSLNF